MNYPCPNHRGLNNPQTAGNLVRQDGSHLWRDSLEETNVPRSTRYRRLQEQRTRWAQNPDLYELGDLTPQDLRNMSEAEWRDYNQEVLNGWAHGNYARHYANDPKPWGRNRPGGPLPDY
jgi:hypothetical protein